MKVEFENFPVFLNSSFEPPAAGGSGMLQIRAIDELESTHHGRL